MTMSGLPCERAIERRGALGDRSPAEALDDTPAAGLAQPAGELRVVEKPVDRLGQVTGELVWVSGSPEGIVAALERHEVASLALDHDLGNPAGRAGDHRGLAGHRLQVDQTE